MNQNSQTEISPFVRAAQQRWPLAQITGDGDFALVASCCPNKTVRLYGLAMIASAEGTLPCGHAHCKMVHHVYRLQPVYPKRRMPASGNPAEYE